MENCNSSKRLKNTTTHEDFISELPDSVLVHILSFLPIRDAIKTVLLRRFGKLWRSLPTLDLNVCLYHSRCSDDSDYEAFDLEIFENQNRKFSDLIHHVTNLHDSGVLDKLSLRYYYCIFYSYKQSKLGVLDSRDCAELEREKAIGEDIEKLVSYAIKSKVKILDLNLRGCSCAGPHELYALPCIFRSNYLTDMRLISCNIKSLRGGEFNLKVLRVLFLDSVLLSDETMENILVGCPFLEDLSLLHCWGLGKLYCKNYPNLKKLMLSLNPGKEMSSLHVSCPHVTSFKIADWIVGATMLDDVSSPIDASISFEYFFAGKLMVYDGVSVQSLLHKISMCKTITLCGLTILLLMIWNFKNVPCSSYQWKNLIIKLEMTKWHHPGLSWLLKSCHSLETLTIYIARDVESFLSEKTLSFFAYDYNPQNCWDLREATFPCLECIVIHGYINEPYVDQMLKFLLKNATKLEKWRYQSRKFSSPMGATVECNMTGVLRVKC